MKAMNIYFNDFMKNGSFKPDTFTRNELTSMIMNHKDFADPDKRNNDMKLKFSSFVDIDWENGVATQ